MAEDSDSADKNRKREVSIQRTEKHKQVLHRNKRCGGIEENKKDEED